MTTESGQSGQGAPKPIYTGIDLIVYWRASNIVEWIILYGTIIWNNHLGLLREGCDICYSIERDNLVRGTLDPITPGSI